MDSDPAWFDNPQGAGHRSYFHHGEEVSQPVNDALNGRPGPNIQNDYSSALFRWESQHLAKIAIESDQRASLGCTNFQQYLVAHPLKVLVPNRHYVVAGSFEKFQAAAAINTSSN